MSATLPMFIGSVQSGGVKLNISLEQDGKEKFVILEW